MTLLGGPLKVNLLVERLSAGHSIRSFSRLVGVSAQTVTRAENGEPIAPPTAHKIAAGLGLEIKDVWPLGCGRSGCTSTATHRGLCEAHHEQQFDHARDAEEEQ